MSSTSGDWAALASQNERLMQPDDGRPQSGDASLACTSPAAWAELASQCERLADTSGPRHGLASSGHRTSEFRLVVKAA